MLITDAMTDAPPVIDAAELLFELTAIAPPLMVTLAPLLA
jgi:hypothetical protein